MILIDDHIQDYTPGQIARWLDELPEWRRRQALAFKHDAGRRQSLLAYRLLCQGLREEYGIEEPPKFLYGEHGKPYLAPLHPPMRGAWEQDGPFFSLSHCREAVCCVVSDHLCGIDIETVGRKVSDSLVRYAMTDEEQRLIASEGPLAFLRLWTQKEAVAKLQGTGIGDGFKNILNRSSYRVDTRETDRWVMSVAAYSLVQ